MKKQKIKNENLYWSFGKKIILILDILFGLLGFLIFIFFLNVGFGNTTRFFYWSTISGVILGGIGAMLSAINLMLKNDKFAIIFQACGALGGILLIIGLILFLLLPTNPPVIALILIYGLPAFALIFLFFFLRFVNK